MPTGTVKWFDNRKGWGFVVQPDGSDLFVHYTSIMGDGFRRLDDGAQVEYDLEDGPKGPQAGNVRLLDDGSGGPDVEEGGRSEPAAASPSEVSDSDDAGGEATEPAEESTEVKPEDG